MTEAELKKASCNFLEQREDCHLFSIRDDADCGHSDSGGQLGERTKRCASLACVSPPGFARFDTPLKRVAGRISAHQRLTIVAIGSSSTFGAGASSLAMSYPSRLAVELRALLPRSSITVINRGVNGDTAQEMLARFDRDVFAAGPDLVLWQVGSNAVLLDRPIASTGLLIDEGLRRLKGAGSDVVLIDPQYAPKVIAKHDEHDVDLMVALISTASRDTQIDLFQRFALMRYWRLTKGLPRSALSCRTTNST